MREVLLLALFGYLAVICRETSALQEPIYGSGSGDEEPSVVASTSGTSPPNSVSPPDDEDFGSGSATTEASTVQDTTIVTETTTQQTSTESTTKQPTTTAGVTTVEHTTKIWGTVKSTDDDDFSGSGSASGSGIVVTDPTDETSTRPTTPDIFIDVISTTDNTLIIKSKREPSTEGATTRSTSSPETTQSQSLTNTKKISTSSVATKATKKATTLATTKEKSTISIAQDTESPTKKQTQKTVTERPSTRNPKYSTESREESTERPGKVHTTRQTTKESENTSTTSKAQVLARKGEKQEEGFTLTTEVIAGVVACALLALLLIAFLMYRLKKRDEGSYLLDESSAYPSDYKKLHPSDKEAFI